MELKRYIMIILKKKETFGTIEVIYIDKEDDIKDCDVGIGYWKFALSEIKLCLFPLLNMTDEEKNKLDDKIIELELKSLNDEINSSTSSAYEIDYYNSHHIDYRGLIEKGIAINATGLNIY